jgi:hypothetical protein
VKTVVKAHIPDEDKTKLIKLQFFMDPGNPTRIPSNTDALLSSKLDDLRSGSNGELDPSKRT